MQAVILAAGMGKRLKELTNNATKCMVPVNGITMIERMLRILDQKRLSRIVIVVGYKGQELIDFIQTLSIQTKIEYVFNTIYYKTNNIFSLYLAKDYLVKEDTLLLESDLVFEEAVLDRILDDPYPSLTLVDKFESWMDGTVVELGEDDRILRFLSKKEFRFEDIHDYYKTVNIYKFSQEFSATHYVPFLEAYSKALGNNEYYEQVLKVIILLDKPDIKAIKLKGESWYEIDDIQDLDIAESIFASPKEKLKKLQQRYGGYWRYPHLIDFCYLVNPYYPNQKLIDEIKSNFEHLLRDYPSGMHINSLLAAKFFGLHEENIVIGNGAAELIKVFIESTNGKLGIILPTFEEYPNRKSADQIVPYTPLNENLSYTADDIIDYFSKNQINILTLINPDNPSGNYIRKKDLLQLVAWAQTEKITLVIDESFVDFAEEEDASLLHQDILAAYPNLLVVKSISKSFGVPGLRLGVLASGDTVLIDEMKKKVSIWNINSFAEFYMQIGEKYQAEYQEALRKFKSVRKQYIDLLKEVPGLRLLPTQANYITCEISQPHTAQEVTERLLNDYHILIKDLSAKKGFPSPQFIRIAIRTPEDNHKLVCALKEILQS